jgi:CelD/BcsL family acetyltransferase involved in cellulose biosynthesis
VRGELIGDVARLEQLRSAWDELAVEAASPYSAPGWLLAWWRHAAPPGSRLHAVAAHDGAKLAGLAPFFSTGRELRLLGARTSFGVQPLSRAGCADEVAAVVAEALRATGVELVRLEGVPAPARWPARLADAWPGARPWRHVGGTTTAPRVGVHGRTFEEWLATLNPKFRKNSRRLARRLEEQGAIYRLATDPEEIERDVRSFIALHHARWAARGGSAVVDDGVARMLQEAARELAPARRIRLWSLDVDGRTIAGELFVAGGGRVSSWLGGFDDAWAAFEPSKQLILKELEHAFARNDTAVDLGPGEQEFKARFADGRELLEWSVLVPRGRHYRATRLRLLRGDLRRAASRRLPPGGKRALKRLLRVTGS